MTKSASVVTHDDRQGDPLSAAMSGMASQTAMAATTASRMIFPIRPAPWSAPAGPKPLWPARVPRSVIARAPPSDLDDGCAPGAAGRGDARCRSAWDY